jgi:hypothetical protein
VVRAETAQQEALGYAMTGKSLASVERKLGEAEAHLGKHRVDGDDPLALGVGYSDRTRQLREAACYSEAQRGDRAATLIGDVIAGGGLSRRDTAYFRARRSVALVKSGELGEAVETALISLDGARMTGSRRTLVLLEEAAQRLRSFRERPEVRVFYETFGESL